MCVPDTHSRAGWRATSTSRPRLNLPYFLPLVVPDSHSHPYTPLPGLSGLSPRPRALPSALSFLHPIPFSAWTFCLCVKSPHIPGQSKLLAPLPTPIWPRGRMDYVSILKRHRHSPWLQGAWEPKALKHRGSHQDPRTQLVTTSWAASLR